MKIGLYTNTVFKIGGVARVVTLMCNHWAKQHDVTIITTHPDYPIDYSIYQLNTSIKICFEPAYFLCTDKVGELTEEASTALHQYLTQQKFDVIIAVEGLYTMAISEVLSSIDCLKIAWMHNSYQAYFNTEGAYLWQQDKRFKKALAIFNKCVVLTHSDQEEFDQAFSTETKVIANPLTFRLEETIPAQSSSQSFLTLCRIDVRHKGLDLLIKALPTVFEKYPHWKWVLVGDGPDMEQVREMLIEYKIASNVELVGATYHVQPFYQDASFFVLPSRWEGLPMVSLEAMAYGLTLIGFNIGALNEVLGETLADQWLVEPYDSQAMAQKIIECIELGNSPWLTQMIRDRAKNFTLPILAEKWEALFKKE